MTEFIENIFSTIFGNNVILATILIATIPIIELKGAIPFSMSPEIWGTVALSEWKAFLFAFLGSSLIVPILALIYNPIIKWLKTTKLFRKIAEKIENRVSSKKQKIEEDVNNKTENKESLDNSENRQAKKFDKKFILKLLGVFMFVAIPLPLTGVWTGTCIAVALGLNFGWTCLTIISGNLIAGLIITLISHLFGEATIIFVYILLAIVVLVILFGLIKKLISKKASEKTKSE
ncbi:MAG: small multi-drug export protein [Clostridia bacterium]|nr:small multi-drug export protein [Clostridia bacterium]